MRGVPIKRVRAARELASGRALEFEALHGHRPLFNTDPIGELTIRVPESELDPLATVIELEITPAASA